MDINEFMKIAEENPDYIKGLITPDSVKAFLETDDGKKVLQPYLDKNFTKGLETWKQNNLTKLVDDEVSKRFPEESAESKELKKLKAEFEAERQARVREHLKNKAITQATQKGLPIDLVDHFVGQDEDTTISNLSKFEQVWQSSLQSAVEGKFKGSGRDPRRNDDPKGTFTRAQIESMTPDEINKNWEQISKQMSEGKI